MTTFTAPTSLLTLHSACAQVGWDLPSDPELVRLGENAVWRLPEGVIARVARSEDRYAQAQRGVALARWMAEHQVPVAAPIEGIDNPHRTPEGGVVTFWQEIPQARPASPGQLGAALASLHRMPAPSHVDLPRAAAVDKAEGRLRVVDLEEEDRAALLELAARLQGEYAGLSYELEPTVVHGDAHAANLMATPHGEVGWVDLDGVGWGQPEWDLVLTAIEHECGWVTDREYGQFVDAYGYDVMDAPAYATLRGIRLLRMTSWLAQLPGAVERAEVERRVRDLRGGGSIRGWRAF